MYLSLLVLLPSIVGIHRLTWAFLLINLFPEVQGRRQKLNNVTLHKWSFIIFNQCSKKGELYARVIMVCKHIISTKDGSSQKRNGDEMRNFQKVFGGTTFSLEKGSNFPVCYSLTQLHSWERKDKADRKFLMKGTFWSRREFSSCWFFLDP